MGGIPNIEGTKAVMDAIEASNAGGADVRAVVRLMEVHLAGVDDVALELGLETPAPSDMIEARARVTDLPALSAEAERLGLLWRARGDGSGVAIVRFGRESGYLDLAEHKRPWPSGKPVPMSYNQRIAARREA